MKHTPGPWETSRDAVPPGRTQVTVYAEKNGERVATAFLNEANAKLVAAAPELLKALQELEKVESSPHTETVRWFAMEQARAAIAKAT